MELDNEQKKIINKAIDYLKNNYSDEYTGHDYWHMIRVYQMATELSQKEGADLFIVQMAALLHDVDDRKLSPETHERLDNAVRFMETNHISEDDQNRVCDIIRQVSYRGKDSVAPASIEGKCVQDADRLDALGAIGIARIFAFGGSNHRPIYDPRVPPIHSISAEEYATSPTTSVNHFYEKIFHLKEMMNTKTARSLAEQREAFMKNFLTQFFSEWKEI